MNVNRKEKTIHERERRQKLREAGLCIQCQKPSPNGWLCSSCKQIAYEKRKRWRNTPIEIKKQVEYRRTRIAEIKNEIFQFLGNKCVHCGFDSDPRAFQIDHVKGNGSKERKQKYGKNCGNFTYYLHILKALRDGSKDYQLLCANCNVIKCFEEKEWRK